MKKFLVFTIIILAVGGMVWFSDRGSKAPSTPISPSLAPTPSVFTTPSAYPAPEVNPQSPVSPEPASGLQMPEASTGLEGTLQASDNKNSGNYMLVMERNKKLYISTGRNYDSLIGKSVIVDYEGTLEDFTLKNITEK
jgi:hypothetical protein